MDKWKFYDVRHKRHLLCNPLSREKFERLVNLIKLEQGAHVLDIACGKGEFLVRLAERFEIKGMGIDLSPFCIQDCLAKKQKRVPTSHLQFLEMDGAKYQPQRDESFDLAMCIGASWVYAGHRGTLRALKKMTKPGGMIIVGEPFWLKEPSEEYLKAEELTKEQFGTHYENVRVGEEEGLRCLYTLVSNKDDWDHYETLQWWATDEFLRSHPNDPDVHELDKRNTRSKEAYLRWGRDTLGWAIYVFTKPIHTG